MTLLSLVDLDMVSGPSPRLVGLFRIWRNLKVVNICLKIIQIPTNGATGPSAKKIPNLKAHLKRKEPSDENALYALEAGHASAIKLKNAKAAPHSVVASAREHKDDDDDDADGDDADGSGAN